MITNRRIVLILCLCYLVTVALLGRNVTFAEEPSAANSIANPVATPQESASVTGQNEGSQSEGYDAYTSETATDSTGNYASKDSYAGVVGSWDTGIHVETVTSDNQVFSTPEVTYGSTTFPAMSVTSGEMGVGAEIYIVAVYAERAGYVIKDGVRTPVAEGDLIAYIPAGGLQKEDGSWSTAWSILNSSGKYGDVPISQALERLYQYINQQDLAEYLKNDPRLTAWGGLEYLKTLSKDEIKKILCETNCDEETTPPPSTPSCHIGSHAGWTEGQMQVKNFTTGKGWTSEVWARPGDTVRFSMYYCWGVGAVGGSADNNPSSPWAIYPGGNAIAYGSAVNEVWFNVSASPNNNYLFGYDEHVIRDTGTRHVLTDPHQSNIGGAAPELSSIDGDSLSSDYSFLYYSPSERGEDADSYNCSIFDFGAFTISNGHGYQIPGVGTGSCGAISQNGGNMNDAGSSFSQTITYSYDTAWQRYRHNETGGCNGACTWQVANPTPPQNSVPTYTDEQQNTLREKNANRSDTPYQTLQAALGAGVNDWGLVKKHDGDTTTTFNELLPGDCDSSTCGANNWEDYSYTWSECPCVRANRCSWCIDWGDATADNNYDPPCIRWSPTEENESKCGCAVHQERCWGPWRNGSNGERHNNPGKSYYKPEKDYSTGQQQLGTQSSTAIVNVPYSYRTATTSTIQEGDVIYLGETVSSLFTASIIPRVVTNVRPGEAYATVVPGRIQAVEFVVDANSNLSPATGSSNADDKDPCEYYKDLGRISDCNTIWEERGAGGYLNEEGRYGGKTYSSGSVTRVVPDVYPVGSKYCVAVGISTSDSHSQPDTQVVRDMGKISGWRISNLSCRTIAKKPNFQVWNGNFYTKGGIATSITTKRVGANLGDPSDPTGYFGSWGEYIISAKGNVIGMSSAAGLGYYGGYNNRTLGLQGGTSPGKPYCDISRMTIANDKCTTSVNEYYSNRFATGNSLIEDSAATLLERIRSRYLSATHGISQLDNGATYIYPDQANISTSELYRISHGALANTQLSGSVIRQTKSAINAQSEQTTRNYASNALIIHVDGTLTIDTDICTGNGTCGSNPNLVLNQRNSDYYTNIYSLPQVLIIADGGIVIKDNVTQIDAWLITNGNINTCNGLTYNSNGFSANACANQLIINGPIFANSLTLVRNSGANGGVGSGNPAGGNPITFNLTDDGSIQPAEIINLRPDVLFWAYSQAQRFSQANVTYTRELAPRY